METFIWVAVAVVVIAVAAGGVGWWVMRERRRTEHLTEQFGPEYQRAIGQAGDRRTAEHELEEREQRVGRLDIHPLADRDRERYATEWRDVQGRFVDDPSGAIAAADRLVQRLMLARGYPMTDFEQRAADVSVDHAGVVEEYRSAHDIAERHAASPDGVGTEELRQAMIHNRALFDELLEASEREPAGA